MPTPTTPTRPCDNCGHTQNLHSWQEGGWGRCHHRDGDKFPRLERCDCKRYQPKRQGAR